MVDEATSSKPFTAARDGVFINAGVGCESFEWLLGDMKLPPAPRSPSDFNGSIFAGRCPLGWCAAQYKHVACAIDKDRPERDVQDLR
jgi:hypothetical protein